jgi:hypothetical protein
MEILCSELIEIEAERCEAVHSSINKLVVYEKFSEMNNKYDVNNFVKVLDDYTKEGELQSIVE